MVNKIILYSFLIFVFIFNTQCFGAELAVKNKVESDENSASETPNHAPYGMVNIYALQDGEKLVVELDTYSKKDRVLEFFNNEGESLGLVTIWAYNKKRTFISTLKEGNYTYHISDENGTWKGQLVIIN